MLSELTVIEQITVLEDGQVNVKHTTRILRDGVEVAMSHPQRHVIFPGLNYAAEDPRVVAVCQVVHTPTVIAAYEEAEARIAAA